MAWAEAYLRTKWHLDPSSRLATMCMGQKVVGCAPFLGGAGSPTNAMSPGPRPTSLPSGIVIHPAVRPHQTWAENWEGSAFLLTQCGLFHISNTSVRLRRNLAWLGVLPMDTWSPSLVNFGLLLLGAKIFNSVYLRRFCRSATKFCIARGIDGYQILRDFCELWSTFCDCDTMRRLVLMFSFVKNIVISTKT